MEVLLNLYPNLSLFTRRAGDLKQSPLHSMQASQAVIIGSGQPTAILSAVTKVKMSALIQRA